MSASRRRLRAPPRPSPTSSPSGPAWATTGGRSLSTAPRSRSSPATADGFPTTWTLSGRLPGIGAYTARAVLAFAFDRDVGVVEVNTARVLARAVAGRRLAPAEAQSLADDLVPDGRGWAWNQALLDLGATVCAKRLQVCGDCPVRPWCGWAAEGRPAPDPSEGSAGTGGRQSPFAGSDRQGRGRLVDALRRSPLGLAATEVLAATGWPDQPDRARRVAASLVADGLAVTVEGGRLRLP